MDLISVAADVDKLQSDGYVLVQCPRTEVVYVIEHYRRGHSDELYYFAKQQPNSRYVVDTDYPDNVRERYYFSTDRLKEMITDKSFAIER